MAKKSKLDALLQATDKIMGSKGVSKATHTLDKSLGVLSNMVQGASNVANHQIDVHAEKHKDDVKVPDLAGLSREQAQAVLDQFKLTSAFVELTQPAAKYATLRPNTVVNTVPKANVTVPAGSFVKVLLVPETLITASQALVDQATRRKQKRKAAAVGLASKLGHGTVTAVTSATKLPKKLSRKPKVIDGEFVDVPDSAERSDAPK